MHSYLYIFAVLRCFCPIKSFITEYLIQSKKVKNRDIYNKALPWFFVCSLFIPIIFSLFSHFGNKKWLYIYVILDTLSNIILLLMPIKSIFMAKIYSGLNGICSSLSFITHCVVYEIEEDNNLRNKVMGRYQTLRRTSQILGSFLAQNLRIDSGNNIISLYISVIVGSISIIFTYLLNPTVKKTHSSFYSCIYEYGIKYYIYSIYNSRIIFYSLMNVIASIIYISFAVYSSNILIERKKNMNIQSDIFSNILFKVFYPLRIFSYFLTKIFSLMDERIFYQTEKNKEIILFGYIDGICKLLCILIAYPFVCFNFSDFTLRIFNMVLVIIIILLTLILNIFTTLISTYIIFLLGFCCSNTLINLSHNGLNKEIRVEEIVSANFFVGTIIHLAITFISKYRKCNAAQKMYYYSFVAVILFSVCLSIFLYDFYLYNK